MQIKSQQSDLIKVHYAAIYHTVGNPVAGSGPAHSGSDRRCVRALGRLSWRPLSFLSRGSWLSSDARLVVQALVEFVAAERPRPGA
jgi:hypothetical protein